MDVRLTARPSWTISWTGTKFPVVCQQMREAISRMDMKRALNILVFLQDGQLSSVIHKYIQAYDTNLSF
jgi:hypothetical protein